MVRSFNNMYFRHRYFSAHHLYKELKNMHARGKEVSSQFLRILQFPVTRLVILIAIIFYLYISGHIFRAQYAHNSLMNVVVVLCMILITMSIYAAFVRYVERRSVSELATHGMGCEFGTGLLMGFGLFVVYILILMVLGIYKIEGLNKWVVLFGPLCMGLSSGFFEEMLFRGVLFRIVEESMGSLVALAVSSLGFGLIHLQNPCATFQGVLFIAIEGNVAGSSLYTNQAPLDEHGFPYGLKLYAVFRLTGRRLRQPFRVWAGECHCQWPGAAHRRRVRHRVLADRLTGFDHHRCDLAHQSGPAR